MGQMSFKLNCGYHARAFYEKDLNSDFQSKFVEEIAI